MNQPASSAKTPLTQLIALQCPRCEGPGNLVRLRDECPVPCRVCGGAGSIPLGPIIQEPRHA